MLKVRIENENQISACSLKAGRQRQLMAVIAREIDTDDMRVCLAELLDKLPRAVLRSVIDENNFVITSS